MVTSVLWRVLLAQICVMAAVLASAPSTAPPGLNVHRVTSGGSGTVWRGAAPRRDTIKALAASAAARGVTVTLVDLRHPPTSDDHSGKTGRLSPAQEEAAAAEIGLNYVSISAMDKNLVQVIDRGLKAGDVYIHCMYGVNRTGFATARYARARRRTVSRTGLGKRDWAQGDRFQAIQESRSRRRAGSSTPGSKKE